MPTGEVEGLGVDAAPSYALHPGRAPLLILGPFLWKRRQHWLRERGPPGTKRPGNMEILLEEEPASWLSSCLARSNVHVAQTESHNYPGPGILSHATFLLAIGPFFWGGGGWGGECADFSFKLTLTFPL